MDNENNTQPPVIPPATPVTPTPPVDSTPPTPPATPTTPSITPPVIPVTPLVVPPAVPPTPEDTAKLREEITKDVSGKVSEEVSKSVIRKIGDALGLSKKEEEKLPTDAESLKKIVDTRVGEVLEKRDKELEDKGEQAETEKETRIDNIIKGWHTQYSQLAIAGKVPVIKNENDTNDRGVVARRKFIQAIGKMIDTNKLQGVDYVPSVADVLVMNPDVLKGPAGANMPISGATPVQGDSDSFSNKEIRGKTMAQIASESS